VAVVSNFTLNSSSLVTGEREVFFTMNGQPRSIMIRDNVATASKVYINNLCSHRVVVVVWCSRSAVV